MQQSLNGIRVLDLSDIKGAYCGKLMADMGADVVKVEPPEGDATRRIGPFFGGREDPERSLAFWHYHTSKRGITLDLAPSRGREIFLRLASDADVVLETYPPGRLESWGLGYDRLRAENPRLVLASLTPFGQSGPYRDWRASDTVAQAMGGMLFVNGHPDQPPLRGLGPQAYHSASTYTAIAVMLALLARESAGRGQHIDVSLQECVAATVEHVSGFYHQNGTIEERRGSLHWSRYFRVAECRDGYALHCTLGDWTSLLEWVKSDGKAADLVAPEWDRFQYRRDNCEHLFDVLDEWAKDYRVADLVEGAQLRRLPYAAVLPMEALPDNPQLQERGFLVDLTHDDLGATLRYPGAPYVMSATPWHLGRRAPRLGEHNAEVYGEIGIDGAALAELRAERIV